jgi:hypothetical protein
MFGMAECPTADSENNEIERRTLDLNNMLVAPEACVSRFAVLPTSV